MNSTTAGHESRKTKPFYQDLSMQVFAGMALGALIGWLWPQSAEWMRILGDLFIRLIAMFVGLIIFCAVVHGIATVREAKKVGRVAIKALIYFEVVTTFALAIGLAMINLLGPGRGMHVDLQSISGSALDPYLKTAQEITGSGFLLSIVPHTAISAFTEGNVLQVVFLSVLFAFGLHAIGADGQPMIEMIELTKRIVFKIIGYIMCWPRSAPWARSASPSEGLASARLSRSAQWWGRSIWPRFCLSFFFSWRSPTA